VFAVSQDEIQVRVNNLEDRFDENPNTYVFNAKRFARQYYFEANEHLFTQLPPQKSLDILQKIKLQITEMNLAGSLSLEDLKKKVGFTQWKVEEISTKGSNSTSKADIKPPQDHLFERKSTQSGHNYSLEPQRIRVFNVRYVRSDGTDILKAINEHKASQKTAGQPAK
jgi:hypothetical protein